MGDSIMGMLIFLLILVFVLFIVATVFKNRAQENERRAQQNERMAHHNARVAEEAKLQFTNLSNEVEQKAEEKRRTARRRYVTKAMKQQILERDDYTCQICGISKGLLDRLIPRLGDFLLLEIDHIIPVANGGSGGDENNLQTLCWRCNRKKGKNKTNEQVKDLIDYGVDKLDVS